MALSAFSPSIRNAIYQAMGISEEEDTAMPNIESGSEAGSNYLGVVQRVEINGKTLIIKTQPNDETRQKIMRSEELFRNESNFYNIILPRLQPLTQAPMVIPKVFLANTDILVMENLTELGYRTVPRGHMNLSMAKIIIKTMAAFHASSMAVKHLAPEDFKIITSSIKEIFHDPLNEGIKNLISQFKVEDHIGGNDDPELISKFTPFFEKGFEILVKYSRAEEADPYESLCHGDMWTNNFMFSYENDEIVSMALLDFQTLRIASPVTDLLYFIYICTDVNFRKAHLKSLLDLYYSTFTTQIMEYDLDPDVVFPVSAYQEHLKKFNDFGIFAAVLMIPLFLNDGPPIDMDFETTKQFTRYISKPAAARMKEMLKEYLQNELTP